MSINTNQEKEHCRDVPLFTQLLQNEFENEYYEITFSENNPDTPNTLKVTFKQRLTGEEISTYIGLHENKDGKVFARFRQGDLNYFLIDESTVPLNEELDVPAESLWFMLNYELKAVAKKVTSNDSEAAN